MNTAKKRRTMCDFNLRYFHLVSLFWLMLEFKTKSKVALIRGQRKNRGISEDGSAFFHTELTSFSYSLSLSYGCKQLSVLPPSKQLPIVQQYTQKSSFILNICCL